MKRLLILATFVILGLICGLGLYTLGAVAIIEPLRRASGHSPESYLGLAFLVVLPLSLFLASGITGYLCSPHVRTKLGFLWVTPGLYFSSAMAANTLVK